MVDPNILEFVRDSKLLTIATVDEMNNPWICNVYFSSDDNLNFYLITSPNSNHGKHIAKNKNVAFTIAKFDPNNLNERIAIQCKGEATIVSEDKEIEEFFKIHLQKFPEFKSRLNIENIKNKTIESRPYKITTKYIKFWSDKFSPEEKIKEFNL